MISAHTDAHEVVDISFDKPRKLLADVPAQLELETKTGLGMRELHWTLVGKLPPKLIRTASWVLMKHAGEKLPPLNENFDALYGQALGKPYEHTEKGVADTGRVTNAYLASRIVKALKLGHALDEDAEDASAGTGGDETVDPTSGPSPST